jgi:hypothetical protein
MFKEISNTLSDKDKRFHFDRRRRTTPLISRYTFTGGRRRTVRRITDRGRHLLVDFYSPRLMVALLAASLTILCIFKHFKFARTGLVLSLIAYVSIVLYEFCILSLSCSWFH